jgi:copper homeostasis protein
LRILVEAAVESIEESLAAERAGAGRLELCANLDVGGTTPDASLIARVKDAVALPVAVMIRPRGGSFVFTADEVEIMRNDIEMARGAGADALVIGALAADGTIDVAVVRDLVDRAKYTPIVFHRAFDATPDLDAALETLIDAGVTRVLTSGGAPTALEGAPTLARLRGRGDGRIEILAGGKIRGANAADVVRISGVTQVHARGAIDTAQIREIVTAFR